MQKIKDEDRLIKIIKKIDNHNPNPKIELNYTNNYTLLVAIVLSAQTTDKNVNKATENLFKNADSPEKMIQIGEKKLKEYIKSLGFYNNKTKNVISLSKKLIEKHNGKIPKEKSVLTELPGVGSKTANVYLNTTENKPYIGVDTHVFRVSNRIPIAKGKTAKEIEVKLDKKIPDKYKYKIGHQLVLFGRYICKAKKPDCQKCPILSLCNFKNKNL